MISKTLILNVYERINTLDDCSARSKMRRCDKVNSNIVALIKYSRPCKTDYRPL